MQPECPNTQKKSKLRNVNVTFPAFMESIVIKNNKIHQKSLMRQDDILRVRR